MPQKGESRDIAVLHDSQCPRSSYGPFVVLQRRARNQSADNFQRQVWVLQVRGLTETVIKKGPVNNSFCAVGDPMEICIFKSYRREHLVPVNRGKAV